MSAREEFFDGRNTHGFGSSAAVDIVRERELSNAAADLVLERRFAAELLAELGPVQRTLLVLLLSTLSVTHMRRIALLIVSAFGAYPAARWIGLWCELCAATPAANPGGPVSEVSELLGRLFGKHLVRAAATCPNVGPYTRLASPPAKTLHQHLQEAAGDAVEDLEQKLVALVHRAREVWEHTRNVPATFDALEAALRAELQRSALEVHREPLVEARPSRLAESTKHLLDSLTPKEREVLERRFATNPIRPFQESEPELRQRLEELSARFAEGLFPVGTRISDKVTGLSVQLGKRTHELKCWPDSFGAIVRGDKRAELRKNDRKFQLGDELELREWDDTTKQYTGRRITVQVTDILYGGWFGLPLDLCVMSIVIVGVGGLRKDGAP